MELTQQPSAKTLIPTIAITDGELLMRFSRHGDQAAFTTLVEKHGRLVWAVCWQVLREHHEIEDAFQSTFFILAKRARSIRSCDSLCGWLYRVAYRTALRARMASKPKPLSELVADELASPDDKFKAIEQHEQRAVLMEELHTLPEHYQQPLILCYLEGKSRRTIADELGCSLETIKGRLSRGRQVLRHRLIRRGFSLSVAMGAMSVPIKFATAAVTPKLVSVTITGATAWAAGAAKISTTVSSQVIHLAQQGTVAMTVASFAKPVMIGVALLGVVSASLAVDAGGQGGKGAPTAQTINLAVADDTTSFAAAGEDETAVEVTVGKEVFEENEGSYKNVQNQQVTSDFAAEPERLGIAVERQPAPPRTAQPVTTRVPQPLWPLNTYSAQQPLPYYMPPTVYQPVEVQIGGLNVEANLKLRSHEAKVAELQLESKELEIQSFDATGEDKEALLRQSRKKLLMAEAEELRMQVERQKEEIKQLEKAMKGQAEGIKKQAAEQAEQAKQAAKYAAATMARGSAVARETQSVAAWPQPNNFDPEVLQAGDQIMIEAIGVLPDKPIGGLYVIEPGGTVPLGAAYGRVAVAGMTVIDAEQAILRELKKTVEDPRVQVTLKRRMSRPYVPANNAGWWESQPHSSFVPADDNPFAN